MRTNKLNPHMMLTIGIELESHRWEASPLKLQSTPDNLNLQGKLKKL